MNWHAGQSGLLSFQLSEKNACCSTWRTGHCIRSANTNAMSQQWSPGDEHCAVKSFHWFSGATVASYITLWDHF